MKYILGKFRKQTLREFVLLCKFECLTSTKENLEEWRLLKYIYSERSQVTDKQLINIEVSLQYLEVINISTCVLFFPLYVILFRAVLSDIQRIRNIPITDGKELTRNVKKICAVMI